MGGGTYSILSPMSSEILLLSNTNSYQQSSTVSAHHDMEFGFITLEPPPADGISSLPSEVNLKFSTISASRRSRYCTTQTLNLNQLHVLQIAKALVHSAFKRS